jgi:hypothetical protein
MAKQMSRVVKDLKYKASEKGLDSFTETKLQQWLAARADLLNPEMQRLFKRMYQFALQTQFEGFDPVFKKLVGGRSPQQRPRLRSN